MPTPRSAIVAAALLTAVGCMENKEAGETFRDQEHPTPIGLVTQAQAASGAKQDATLYDCHFRSDRLDPLGQGKLSLMLKATAAGDPVDVYLDMPADLAAARRPAVLAYLQQAGVPAELARLNTGPNPGCTTPSSYNLPAIYKDGNTNVGVAADLGVTGGLGANGPGGTVGK